MRLLSGTLSLPFLFRREAWPPASTNHSIGSLFSVASMNGQPLVRRIEIQGLR